MSYNTIISGFLSKKSSLPKLIAIVGPTASGKTDVSVDIALEIGGEIINADSKQLYTGTNITTGVLLEEEKKGVPHHLFSYVDPSIRYTVEDHCNDALEAINAILKRKHIPILVGGTGLFINALTQNFDLPKNSSDPELYKKLDQKTNDELWEELQKVDPEYMKKTHKNNKRRVIRALECFYSSGKKKSEIGKGEDLFDVLILHVPEIPRGELYKKIDQRAEWMWDNGLLDETKVLMERGIDEDLPAMLSHGIPEAIAFLREEMTKEEALAQMQQNVRNYAKRQMTWWRGDDRLVYL